ncbi:GNAT family N-acetyltransferase [Ideonella sp. DXS29W]|uniref:GNAT family N-acetyltransferase n=1 Tax=Ideonella lacteola TaxID=2984193 RepID=A0ABU9BJX3_9BURK
MVTVSLKPWQDLNEAERQGVLALSVSAQQVEYAGTVERSVRACQDGPASEVVGLAILEGMRVVGFLVLKRGSRAPAWAREGAAVVSALRIDLACQGKGLGSAALRILPSWVATHWPDARAVSLSVDEDNLAGRQAYTKAGFVDHGVREEGRIGWVRYMSRPQ